MEAGEEEKSGDCRCGGDVDGSGRSGWQLHSERHDPRGGGQVQDGGLVALLVGGEVQGGGGGQVALLDQLPEKALANAALPKTPVVELADGA
jgi:hypothetical protein